MSSANPFRSTATPIVSSERSDGAWWVVYLANIGRPYLVQIEPGDRPDTAIEVAIDAAIAAGHKGVFHDAEYPAREDFDSDEEHAEACEECEVDMHVVGHTTTPEGWGTVIPQWEITVREASPDEAAYGEGHLAGVEWAEDAQDTEDNAPERDVLEFFHEARGELRDRLDDEELSDAFICGFLVGVSRTVCGEVVEPFATVEPREVRA
jgi:hypothetical protein